MTNIIALSAFTNKKIIEDLLSLGVKQVISKPLMFEVLKEIMMKYYFYSSASNN
jgi:response regulator of citrate/malate metabolism